jgi:hypothetical protein
MALKPSSNKFPGFENIYVLGDPGSPGEFIGDMALLPGREFDLLRSEWSPPSPLAVRWQMGKKSPGDVVWTTLAVPVIISARVVTLLQDNNFTGWSTYPVVVYDQTGSTVNGYFGLSVHGRCGEIDNARSQQVEQECPGGNFPVNRGLFFDPEPWDGSDVFCPAGCSGWVFVTANVKKTLEAAKIDNISLEVTSELERSTF